MTDRPGIRRRALLPLVAVLLAITAGVAACGDGGSTGGAPEPTTAAGKRGQQVAKANGCTNCHTASGRRSTGPTWKDLAGSDVSLADGTTVTADDAYLTSSITEPKAQVVKGFASIMPSYDLTDDQITDLIAYLRELSTNAVPPAAD